MQGVMLEVTSAAQGFHSHSVMPIPVSSSPEPRYHSIQSPVLACLSGFLALWPYLFFPEPPLQACGGTPPPSAHPALLQGSSAGAALSHWACSERYASPHGGHSGGVAVPPPPGLGAVVPGAAETLPRGSEEPSSRMDDDSSHPRSQRPRWSSG